MTANTRWIGLGFIGLPQFPAILAETTDLYAGSRLAT
jgi:hypothetical protein